MNIRLTQNTNEATHITHGGIFHADEVFATAILATLGDVTVMRVFTVPADTRAFVYDIGRGKYDHHQKDGNGARENGIPYASCGLIWRDYGAEAVQKLGCPASLTGKVVAEVDNILIEGIDGIDNGIPIIADSTRMKYHPLNVSEEIDQFNPAWDSHQHPDEAFAAACKFAEGILHRTIEYAISNAKAESRVMDAIQKTVGHTLVLPEYMPWVDAVFNAEREKENELWYIIFPSRRGGYSVQCIPDAPGSFGQRHPLPKDWWGNPKASGVEGCSFVHANGFIAACDTLEHALELAQAASRANE